MRSGPVSRKIRRHKDGLRTQAFSANRRHSGMDTEASGFIRSSTNDRPISPPRHNDRFSAQLRVVPLFDGGIERVHVHMDDFAKAHLAFMIFRYIPDPSTRL